MQKELIPFPRYDGRSDPRRWVNKMNALFRLHQVDDLPGTRAEIAVALLDGPAADWAEFYFNAVANLPIQWGSWSCALTEQFVREQDPDRARDQIRHIFQKRGETLIAYAERFMLMCSRARPAVNHDRYYKYWLRGMRDERAAEYAFTRIAATRLAVTFDYAFRQTKHATEARKRATYNVLTQLQSISAIHREDTRASIDPPPHHIATSTGYAFHLQSVGPQKQTPEGSNYEELGKLVALF